MTVHPETGMARTVFMPFNTTELGGSHVSALELADGLRRTFGTRVIISAPKDAKVTRQAVSKGMGVFESGDPDKWRYNPAYDVSRIRTRIGHLKMLGKYTIVHCNDLGTLQSWMIPAKMTGTPIVYHNRSFDKDHMINRRLIAAADSIISVSFSTNSTIQYVPTQKRSVIIDPFSTPLDPNVKIERFELENSFSSGDWKEKLLVGWVGNFWERKRPEFFVDVARYLIAVLPQSHFVMCGRKGDVEPRKIWQLADKYGIGDRFLFLGFTWPPERNIAPLDLLLAPSVNEAFGRTLVEAILLGVPYVATESAGHKEIHDRWGGGQVLSPEAEAKDYAWACASVLKDKGRWSLPIQERHLLRKALSPENHARNVSKVYNQLIGAKLNA